MVASTGFSAVTGGLINLWEDPDARCAHAYSATHDPLLLIRSLSGLMEQWMSISYSYFKPVQFRIQNEMVSE